jgi:transcriptional regulator with XRE-family HTH domain
MSLPAGRTDGLYARPEIKEAVAQYDFGKLFRLLRAELSLTQEQLGLLVGLSQARVSAVERGHHRIRDIAVVVRIAQALSIPAALLGFSRQAEHVEEVEAVAATLSRRDLLNTSIGLVLAAPLSSALEHLSERLVVVGRPEVTHVGSADVASVESLTLELRKRCFRVGGGSIVQRLVVMALLHAVRDMHAGRCTADLRARLMIATADLAMCAAWMHYDAGDHNTAGRLWMLTLSYARQSEHPLSPDLTAWVLIQMAHQALHLGHPDDALRFVNLAQTTASLSRPVSVATESHMTGTLGWCHAALGNSRPSLRALDEGDELFDNTDRLRTPGPWSQHASRSEMTGKRGLALTLLARNDQRHAAEALPKLIAAADGFGTDQERTRLMVLPVLAVAALRAGDIGQAIHAGHQAIELAGKVSTVRVYPRMRALIAASESHTRDADLSDLRHELLRTTSAT